MQTGGRRENLCKLAGKARALCLSGRLPWLAGGKMIRPFSFGPHPLKKRLVTHSIFFMRHFKQ